MPGADHYRHRDDLLPEAPGVVAAACAYQSSGLPEGDHRGLPSPWVTFIVSVDRPVRVSGTVQEVYADKGKVKVEVSLFGRPTSVELDFTQLKGY